MSRVFLLLVLFGGSAIGIPVPALGTTGDPPAIGLVSAGLDGTARVGEWTPVFVRISGVLPPGESTVEVVTPDPQGHPVRVSSPAISTNSRSVCLFCQPGRIETTIEVRLISDGKVLDTRRLSTEPDENGERDFTVSRHSEARWIVAGRMPAVDEMSKAGNKKNTLADVHITRQPPDAFPADPRSLASYDTILLSGEFTLQTAQVEALDIWVKCGGHLICFFGAKDRVEAFQSSEIAGWFKDIQIQPKRVSDLSGVEAYVQGELDDGESDPLFIGARRVAVADVRLPDSIALDRSGLSGSVLTQTARGFGRVTFAGFDMDRRPLSLWGERGSGNFLRRLGGVPARETETARRRSRVSRSGITELATQFREASEYLPGLDERSTLSVLGIILLYVLIVGPLDYLLVHRFLKRPQLTWLTFPLIVVVGALLAHSAARWSNGTELRVTQVELIDIDTSERFVRQSTWCSIYSPENARYRVAIRSLEGVLKSDEPAGGTPKLGWFGMPEENYGGMYRDAGLELGRPGYVLNQKGDGIDNLPIPIWSNRSLRVQTLRRFPEKLIQASFSRSGTGGQLDPDSQLTHSFPTTIEDWLIVYGNRAYYPRDLDSENAGIRPGEIWTPLSASVTSRDLTDYLNGTVFTRTVDKTSAKSQRISASLTDYDPHSRDLASILTMLSLHERAGGFGYTGLKNLALQDLEMSRHVSLNRALLIGWVDRPGSALQLDGKTVKGERNESFVRILIPVEATELAVSIPSQKDE